MSTPYEKMALGASDYEALCGNCETALEGPNNAKPNDTFRCPKCGNSDTLENVTRIVKEYATEHMAKALNSTLRKAVRGSKSLTLKSSFRPKGVNRFIVKLESH
jgi:DNA-directed RNA polymerase subunit M/transcription elongation factor TFIIS